MKTIQSPFKTPTTCRYLRARKRHYKFSSLRKPKCRTMATLHKLHNQGQDKFIYTCNICKGQVETRYHCSVCDDFDMCIQCYEKDGHPHQMERLGLDLDDGSSSSENQADSLEAKKLSIQSCIQSLMHACQCHDASCSLPSCHKMKRVVTHTRLCKRKVNGGCPVCKQLIGLCCYHAKPCLDIKCPIPFCSFIKRKLNQQSPTPPANVLQGEVQKETAQQQQPHVCQAMSPPQVQQAIDHLEAGEGENLLSMEPQLMQQQGAQLGAGSMQGGTSTIRPGTTALNNPGDTMMHK